MTHVPVRRAAGILAGAVLVLLGCAQAPAGAAAPAAQVVDVTSFGADPAGVADSAPAVKAALRYAKTLSRPVRVIFPKGVYQLYPEQAETRELYVSNTVGADQAYRDKKIGVLVEDMHDVTIDGQGSKLDYHGLQTAFASIRSTDVTFTNFAFDYVAPKVIDATVSETGVADGRAYRVLTLPAGSPYRVADNHITWLGENSPATGQPYWSGVDGMQYLQIHDPVADTAWRADNPLFTGVQAITDLGGRKIRIDYTGATPSADKGLVYEMRQTTREQPGAFIWNSRDVTVRGLDAYYMQTFGLVAQFSENVTIDRNNFRPGPGSGRSTASSADFLQMSGVKGRVSITGNVFDGPQDDPINIHGTYLEVTGKPAPDRLTVSYKHPETAGFPQFHVGDTVELVTKQTMQAAGGQAVVTAVDGPSGMDHSKSLTDMTITLDRPVPAAVTIGGSVVENITYTPSVLVSGNTFRNVPTRGILVTTRRPVVIENNRFDGMTMSSVYISADAYQWYESGPVDDVTIRHNVFTRPSSRVIFVEPTNQVLDAAHPVHHNIKVEDNTFDVGDVNLVDAKSVGGLSFTGNTVRRLDRATLLQLAAPNRCPAVGDRLPLRTTAAQPAYRTSLFVFRGSSDVRIARNRYDNGLNARADTVDMDSQSVAVDHDAASVNGDHVLPVLGAVAYRSSNPGVVRILPDGTALALRNGQARVTAVTSTGAGELSSAPVTVTVGGAPGSALCAG
jgi:hypothetical protein